MILSYITLERRSISFFNKNIITTKAIPEVQYVTKDENEGFPLNTE